MNAAPVVPHHRLALRSDVERIEGLMTASILALFPRYHDARQTASAATYIGSPDTTLIDDGTYYVHETAAGEIVACGGWSRRDKLYTGSGEAAGDARLLDPATEPARVRAMFVRSDWTRRGLGRAILEWCERDARAEGFTTLALMATLPGEQLYVAFGFRETGRSMLPMPDGVELEGVAMQRPIAPG
jgi:GNAT superfamily N-acetyltransferase